LGAIIVDGGVQRFHIIVFLRRINGHNKMEKRPKIGRTQAQERISMIQNTERM